MSFHIVVESKAWNKADLIDDRINVYWENELAFEVLEYQVRDEGDNVVFRSENEDEVIAWLKANEEK